MVYDGLLILAIWMLTLFVLVAVTNGAVGGPALRSLLFLEFVGFYVYFWMFKGQTLGMLAWRLRIQSDPEGPVSLTQVLMRLLAGAAGLACAGLGYFWVFIDGRRRAWPDMFSDTLIVHVPKDAAGA
jgi:uncharacterized RDD family membrane protein YckC